MPVVGLEAARQIEGLRAMRLADLGRDHIAVGDDVVEFVARDRPVIAEIGDLDRCGPPTQDRKTGPERKPVEIHENVDLVGSDRPCDLFIAHGDDRPDMVETRQDALADVAPILLGRAVAVDRDGVAIMLLEEVGHEVGHWVHAIVGRHVADPQLAMRVARWRAEPRLRRREFPRHPVRVGAVVQREVVGQGEPR